MNLGLSGNLTKTFIHSPLSPLLLMAALVLGVVALVGLSREEEPQISVPMVDIMVQAPGLKAPDILELAAKPLEKVVASVNGVEHTYTQITDNQLVLTARFLVGTDEDTALLRIHEKMKANEDIIPAGVSQPFIVGHGINDVAVLTLTLSPKPENQANWTIGNLTSLAQEINSQIAKVKNVGLTYIVGATPNQLRVEPDLGKLQAYGIPLVSLVETLKTATTAFGAGTLRTEGGSYAVTAGDTLKTAEQIGQVMLTSLHGKPVYVADVATITVGPAQKESRTWNMAKASEKASFTTTPAITIAVAKRKGANAVEVSHNIHTLITKLQQTLIPPSVVVTTTRDYGETANQKANELLFHLALATISIVLLIVAMVGKRPGLVVLVVVPVTILLTLFAAYILGYTINRVSLFALIFSIGILVDDAIVVVENIHRHWAMKDGRSATQAAIEAVAEVGNPTIIATLTVVVALLPMMFVSGLMGPYMSPIPAIASLAMVFSFFVAVVLTPWLMVRVDKQDNNTHHGEDKLGAFYRKMATSIISNPVKAKRFLIITGLITLASFAFFPLKLVTVKLLPFDNKSELQIVVDMPAGSSVESTERTLKEAANRLTDIPEITSMQLYAGTASPFNFNGLVRHYFLRQTAEQGDISINLLPKEERSRASHPIALEIREKLKNLPTPAGTRLKVVEVPPGPPVLSTLLAEVYGPTPEARREAATAVRKAFESVPFVVDTDTSFPTPSPSLRFMVDEGNLAHYGANRQAVYGTLDTLLRGTTIGQAQQAFGQKPLEIRVELPKAERTLNDNLLAAPVPAQSITGPTLAELGSLGAFTKETASWPIFRHNGHNAEMVLAELAGAYEAPIYGMLAVDSALEKAKWDGDIKLKGQPLTETKPTLLWDGEWEITATTFTDMGIAFAVALLGIYLLVVGQFGSFKLPVVILVPVPLSLLGIILGHALMRANFTAPSMIGFIALAGIIVRNSILLVDFIRHSPKDKPLTDILIEAGAVRFKPILLTALAAMIGAVFILTDPIFQGLAVSLLFGLMSSTALTLLAVPAVYVVRDARLHPEKYKKK